MKILDYPIYKQMKDLKNILESKKLHNNYIIEDIQFGGTIDWVEIDSLNDIQIPSKKDVYISIENHFNGEKVTKYYDENNNLIAIDFHDDTGIISTEKSSDFCFLTFQDGKDFYSQFNKIKSSKNSSLNEFEKEIKNLSKETNISEADLIAILEEKNLELETISDKTGLSKEEIDNISIIDNLKKSAKEKTDEENKIEINNNSKISNKKEQNNQNKKDNPNIKQETDLSQKINNKYTLGDILGVPDGGKLVVAYSSAIKDNQSTTKFTFLIKDKDGNFSPCNNLELVAGNRPSNDVYASNYNGTVQKGHANSEYRIKSPLSNENYIITATIGSYGYIDLGLGQAPKLQGLNNSDTNLITIPLKTTSTYNTKPITKETLLSYHSDRYVADKRNQEAQTHENQKDKNNDTLTMYDVDGDNNTGTQYLSHEDMIKILETTNLISEKSDEYNSLESLLKDIIKYNLHGNEQPTQQEFIEACNRCREEHPRIQSNKR